METIINQYDTPEAMASHLTQLMDEVDRLGITVDSATSEDETIQRIDALANYLSWFYPNLLDKRFD